MSTVRVTPTAVEIRLTLAEKIGGLVGDLTLPPPDAAAVVAELQGRS